MQLIFRKFPAREVPPLEPGDVYLRANPDCAPKEQGLARLVIEYGPAALLSGSGPAERLVVDVAFTNPTLDDMVAATFARLLLEGRKLPEGARVFADYAAVIRQGRRPTDISPEDSLEGLFLAIRNVAGKDADLTDPPVGERFRKDWARLADCLLKAAEQGVNPLTTAPFAGLAEFMQERAALLSDRAVYRQDILRGERWLVRLPGGPTVASGLFLRRPTSLFFPFWSRADRDAPVGGAYLFLVVHWGEGVWVISTDPAQQLPIQSLAEALQVKEAARDAERAARDPWYDGHHPQHAHTLVAAPRGGTRHSEGEILRTVKNWARARVVRSGWPVRELAAAAAALAAIMLLVLIYLKVDKPDPIAQPGPVVTIGGKPLPASSVRYVNDFQIGDREGAKRRGVEIDRASLPPMPASRA